MRAEKGQIRVSSNGLLIWFYWGKGSEYVINVSMGTGFSTRVLDLIKQGTHSRRCCYRIMVVIEMGLL